MREQKSLIGKRFGRLVVKERVENDSSGHIRYLCTCDCNNNKKVVRKDSLLNMSIQSCGCLQKEKVKEACTKHGFYKERLYKVWDGMKQRCNNPNSVAYPQYGGRGISVCKEWEEDYVKFREFMLSHGYDPEAPFGECTIDRTDNDGDYCPENCRVIPIQEQQNNKSDVFSFILDGRRTTISGAARSRGKTRSCIQYRLRTGRALEDAVEAPLREARTYEANGEKLTIKEWAEKMGVTKNVVEGRLQRHTMQEIVDEYNKNGFLKVGDFSPKFHTVDGITRSQKEWGEILNIPDSTLRYKLKKKTMQEIVDEYKKNP